ncbi:4-hydroxybenzoate octaprenyltransferase [Desulfosarcina alkanivorans]|uniref:4-hydroxybenzoate octaprenyltransferase n=1 Tax=Desulfosarcina alkanivorans TaxID=571177 RepID=A0A5K7YIJ2_9BACT|nr:UbiA-like polyprenyltransferase [Desulfosarcina alkanivorans]BBO66571.1 4-hydroxybenzoate octaprenyltransferase [Desulfosarcina alkanivorans]
MKSESTLQNVLNFTKIEHTAFSLPLILTGAWMGAGNRFPSTTVMVLVVVAAVGARVFGMAMNRVFDRHIDRLNPRTAGRELPSGKMTVSMAMAIAFGGLMVYMSACWILGGWCLMLSPIPLVPLLAYSLLKRFTPLCHFGIGLCLALAPLGAYVAAAGHPGFSAAVVLFSGFVFFWLSGADIVYALMDVDNDRLNDIHSLPAWLGVSGALRVAAGIHLLAWFILAGVVRIMGGGPAAWMALATAAVFLGLMYVPAIPLPKRFFPISTIAGIAGSVAPMIA